MSQYDGRAPSAVRKSIEPLVNFYRQFKPGVTRLVVAQDDYDRLTNAQARTLVKNGFKAIGGKLYYAEFELCRK